MLAVELTIALVPWGVMMSVGMLCYKGLEVYVAHNATLKGFIVAASVALCLCSATYVGVCRLLGQLL